ncbi:MAG: hypothetical protein ABIZ52_07440 [Candidatus Limnocylindrales bacterium]
MSGHGLARAAATAILVASSLVSGVAYQHVTAPPVAAACTTGACATLEIVFGSGMGSGYVSTFPGGMDCEWTGSSRAGTCLAQYDVGTGLDVDLYLDPGPHSYVCYGLTCAALEARLVRSVHLNPGDDKDVFPAFNLGNKTTVSVYTAGTGAGRVTTSPGGLNCRVVAGVKSGTCSYDYWYVGDSYDVTLHRTPDTGSYACSSGAPFCGTPDTDYVSSLRLSPGNSGPPASFWLAVPVTVQVTGSGTVTSNPAGISCPSTCSKWFPPDYPPDDDTKLTATPAVGWYFKEWTGAACGSFTSALCHFYNPTGGTTVGVVFARLATPSPSARATPPATPKPTAKPSTKPPTAPTALPTAAPSVEPAVASSAAPGVPTAAPASPAASPGASWTSDAPTTGPAVSSPAGSTIPPATPGETAVPLPSGSPASGIDPTILVLLLVIAVLTLALGFALGRRRTPA